MDKGFESMRQERNLFKKKFDDALKDKEKATKNLDEAADVILGLQAKISKNESKLSQANDMLRKSE